MLRLFLITECRIALCVYSTFRHHPHHLGYLCAKFCFFFGPHCWASPWRKIALLIQWIKHSPGLFDAPGTFALEFLYFATQILPVHDASVGHVICAASAANAGM